MSNPWETIRLEDYENHMKLDSVRQLQAMNGLMEDQFCRYPIRSAMVLGVAGGNGLEHVNPEKLRRVYGVDINGDYLEACVRRYPNLSGVFVPLQCDLCAPDPDLPRADLVIANLFLEYVGYPSFQRALRKIDPGYVSCAIQINLGEGFVSDSPYLHVFDCLEAVHHKIDRAGLIAAMEQAGYRPIWEEEKALPNGKRLLRVDFTK